MVNNLIYETETKPKLEKVSSTEVDVDVISEYRMYCIALKQLSTIQKGVQAAHAIVEYSLSYKDTEEYDVWSKRDKTIVILNGRDLKDLTDILDTLKFYKIPYGCFTEESLGNIITCVCFITDNRVFYDDYVQIWDNEVVYSLRDIIKKRHLAK